MLIAFHVFKYLRVRLFECRFVKNIQNPLSTLALVHVSETFLAFGRSKDPDTTLKSILPNTFVRLAIRPDKYTEPMLFIMRVLAAVHATIFPEDSTEPMHFTRRPFTTIHTTVWPDVLPESCYLPIHERTFIVRRIRENETTHSIFLTSDIMTFIQCTIWPDFFTESMLCIVLPLSDESSSTVVCIFTCIVVGIKSTNIISSHCNNSQIDVFLKKKRMSKGENFTGIFLF